MSRQSNKRKRNRGTVRWWDGPFEFLWPLTFLGVVILIFGARSMFPERDIRQLMGTRNEPSKKEVVHFNDEETAPGIPKPFYVSRDCGFENKTERTLECGFLYVAEDRGNLLGNGVRLPVIVYRDTSSIGRRSDPLLFIGGGPGASSFTEPPWAAVWSMMLPEMEWIGKRDVIIFDQRGSGWSKPSFDCPDFDWLRRWMSPRSDPYCYKITAQQYLRPLVACRDKLIANGADLSTYSTASIVDDIEDLRKELGIKSWNLWGVSYGSRVALTMMGGKVDGLRSVILEGVLPPGIGDQRNVIGDFARILDRVITQCNSSKNCKSRYPKLVENFNAVLERLGTYPIFINIKRDWTLRSHFIRKSWTRLRLDDVLYVSTIYNELYSSESISALPRLISASAHHNYSPFIEALQEQDLQSLIVNDVAGITIECNDQTGYSRNIQQNWQTMPPTMQRLHEYKRMFDLCDEWANVPSGETHSQPEYSRVPTLLLAGAFDPVTPAELAVQTHKLLPNSYLYVFPGNGHDASENPCAQSIMRAFLDNPDEEPVHDCLASQGPPTFQ